MPNENVEQQMPPAPHDQPQQSPGNITPRMTGSIVHPPRMVVPPPKGMLGSAFRRDPRFGRAPGIYPVHAFGTFAMTEMDDDRPDDEKRIINLCYIPFGVILTNFVIYRGEVHGKLEDSLPEPTVYLSEMEEHVLTMANMSEDDAKNLGTMYFTLPRPKSFDGPAVVAWHQGTVLRIVDAEGAPHHPTEKPLIYMVQWSPVYDGGV